MQTPFTIWMNAWASGWGMIHTGIKAIERTGAGINSGHHMAEEAPEELPNI